MSQQSKRAKNLSGRIRFAEAKDTDLICRTIGKAFADGHYPSPSTDISYDAMTRVTGEIAFCMVRNALEKGFVLMNDAAPAALVVVPFKDLCVLPMYEICARLREYGTNEDAESLAAIFRHIGELKNQLNVKADTIYLEALAVETTHQGQKYASALMRTVLAACHALGKDVLLFTNTKHNAEIYEHLGFEIILEDWDEKWSSYTAFMISRAGKM